jgi:thioesterase domain-containing protein
LSPEEVEAYLNEHIPLSAGMAIHVVEAGPAGVRIEAPLEPNVNHRSTAFGGSVAALTILVGWTLVHLRLQAEGLVTETVIQTSSSRFDAPIDGVLHAASQPIDPQAWERFTLAIRRHGKGRIHVSVAVTSGGVVAATFVGAYVAIRPREA